MPVPASWRLSTVRLDMGRETKRETGRGQLLAGWPVGGDGGEVARGLE